MKPNRKDTDNIIMIVAKIVFCPNPVLKKCSLILIKPQRLILGKTAI